MHRTTYRSAYAAQAQWHALPGARADHRRRRERADGAVRMRRRAHAERDRRESPVAGTARDPFRRAGTRGRRGHARRPVPPPELAEEGGVGGRSEFDSGMLKPRCRAAGGRDGARTRS